MGLSCTGQIFSDWVNGKLGTVSFYVEDTSGSLHPAQGFLITNNTTSVTILIFEGSSEAYTASSVEITYSNCSTPLISFSVSAQKQPYIALAFQVNIFISEQAGLDPIVASVLELIGGVAPPVSFSISCNATEVTYTTSDGACTSGVSSSSPVSVTPSISGSGDSITFSATFSYGSCQELEDLKFNMSLGTAVTGYINVNPEQTSECGYNSSCTANVQANVTVS